MLLAYCVAQGIKKPACNAGDTGDTDLLPGSGRSSGGGKWQPTPVFLPKKSHVQRSLAGYNQKGCKESERIEWKQNSSMPCIVVLTEPQLLRLLRCRSGLPLPFQRMKVKVKSLSRVCVRLFVTPWTAAYQAPPSMGISRQEYWSGVPLPSPA